MGTSSKTAMEIRKELEKIGTSFYVYASRNSTTISISGFDDKMNESIQIISNVFKDLQADEKQMEKLIQGIKAEEKMSKKDQGSLDNALYNYVFYGEKSYFLDRLMLDDVKKLTSQDLIECLKQLYGYETDIYYTGTLDPKEVAQNVVESLPFEEKLKDRDNSVLRIQKYDEDVVYVVHNKRAVQTAINIYSPSEVVTPEDKKQAALFNQYFGGGMSSIVFQEIREFRSLAYSASMYFRTYSNQHPNEKAYLFGYLTTQSDKTIEAMQAMDSLLTHMPEKPDRLDIIKDGYSESINTQKPYFRYLNYSAAYWMRESYTEDPRKTYYEYFNEAEFDEITDFYNKFVKGRPTVYMIVGNTKNFDKEKLEQFGKVVYIDIDDIRKY